MCNFGPDRIPHQAQLCSSGKNIPMLGAPVESLSKRRSLEMSFTLQNAASLLNGAFGEGCDIFITPYGGAKHYMPSGRIVRD